MDLQSIVKRYGDRLETRFGKQLSRDQWSAFNAIEGCRQGAYGDLILQCDDCHQRTYVARSCGHRSCNQCQYHQAQAWLERQRQKQLPEDYFMVTLTLPAELRSLAMNNPRAVYTALMRCAADTLKRFGLNKSGFEAELGLCAVLHTHSRRLDYHPHVHIVLPAGGINRARREWRKLKGGYLFNGRALAKAFRGALLHALDEADLVLEQTPKRWVAHCKKVGRGEQALQYLARYLYRGVISNRHLIKDDGSYVTFRYRDSKTGDWKTRRERGEVFLYLILLHVLPKGFRRARDYGFLHGNAKALLKIVQWVLKVVVAPARPKPVSICRHCGGILVVEGYQPEWPRPG
jgi:Putative transposase/Transposase zinc-binding domain